MTKNNTPRRQKVRPSMKWAVIVECKSQEEAEAVRHLIIAGDTEMAPYDDKGLVTVERLVK